MPVSPRCPNVPPLELFEHFLFEALRPTWQNAAVRVAVRLHKQGDATVPDHWLAKGVLGPKRWAEFSEQMIEFGWLVRAENGCLARAGVLSPLAEEEQPASATAVSPDALRMQIKRQIHAEFDDIRRALGLPAARVDSEQARREVRTFGARGPNIYDGSSEQAPSLSLLETEQAGDQEPNASRASESDLIPIGSDTTHICVESDSDLIRSDGPTSPRSLDIPNTPAFDKLLVAGTPPAVLAEAARRMRNTHQRSKSHGDPPYWKERYVIKVVRSIQAESGGQVAAVMSVDGGAPPQAQPRASPSTSPGPRQQQPVGVSGAPDAKAAMLAALARGRSATSVQKTG
jgi:hypothetical protein